MKKAQLFILGLLFITLFSCNKSYFCGKCNTSWLNDSNLIYHRSEVVTHNGKCYKAFTQGGAAACEPGTIQGDIWKECK